MKRSSPARLLLLVVLALGVSAQETRAVDYVRDIKPILQARCYACHGALQQQAGLRVDTAAQLMRGGDSGPAVVRGDAAASRILQRVTTTDTNERMPPVDSGDPLTPAQIDLLRRWIAEGAMAPANEEPERDPRDHWAFRAPRRPSLPRDTDRAWTRNAIDAFVSAEQIQHKITPQAEAPRALLVRRLYLDLIGLPPSADDLESLAAEQGPDWYERLVDRLLCDPRHGERWARHWMDVWRYSDWWGLGDQLRNSQKHIWHWRDWIIESLNEDLPYDEMVRLMLAADELHPTDLRKLRATGFLARNYFLFNRNQWMDETIEHVSKGMLGLTVNCAKCHDHKYDPIEQKDYYRLRAFFEPYHVRLDLVPGELDLNRDGVPRAFDGLLDDPTYLFVRGQEGVPDKSNVLRPNVPALLSWGEFTIRPVALPAEAYQPERRPWVIEGQLQVARAKRQSADAVWQKAQQEKSDDPKTIDALRNAEAVRNTFQAELDSVQRRADAQRAAWAVEDAPSATQRGVLEQAALQLAQAAVRAERELTVVRAQQTLVNAEVSLAQAQRETPAPNAPDADKKLAEKKANLEKAVTQARTAVEAAQKQLADPLNAAFTRFVGAAWTPTRFFNSTKDDPTVTFPRTSSGRRTALALWITDERHPLTARVAANQIWLKHLGVPLVPTVFDFGRKGTPPTHPALLDFVATELRDRGWSMKRLHRQIVTSSVYRLSSSTAGAAQQLAADSENRWWWRRTPIRLEAEVVRDMLLQQAGVLDATRGGPPVLAPQQTSSTRRSLYFFHSNNDRNLFLTTFDAPLVKDCYRREQSIVPQQALAMSNSQLVLDQSSAIAERILRALPSVAGQGQVAGADDSSARDAEFVRQAFMLLVGIDPTAEEIRESVSALDAWRKLDGVAPATARAYLVWALLNHNDYVTLR